MRHAHMLLRIAPIVVLSALSMGAPPAAPRAQEIEIKPNREPVPEGFVEVRSRILQIPFAHGRVQISGAAQTESTLDAKGHMARPDSEPEATYAIAPAKVDDFHSIPQPKLLPESRWLLGDLGTLVVPIPGGAERPEQIHLCALTQSENTIPIRQVDWHPTDAGSWVLHFQETQALDRPTDPVEWLCLRILDSSGDRMWIQTFGMPELRRGIQKELVSFDTRHLLLKVGDASPFGSLVKNQSLVALYPELEPNNLWLKSKALGAWLACPEVELWKLIDPETRSLVVPATLDRINAYFSGTTTVHLPVKAPLINRDKPKTPWEVSLFGQEGQAPKPETATDWYEPQDPALLDATHRSLIWGPTGNLFAGQTFGQDPEANPAPWELLVPADYLYSWDLRHLVGTGSTYQRFFVSSPTGRDFHGENYNHTTRHSLHFQPQSPKLSLAESPSSDWSGEVTLFLMGHQYRGGQIEMMQESFTLAWPADAGRRLDLQTGAPVDFWYAVSPTGQGTYGVFGRDPGSEGGGRVVLDPSMQTGWSALCVTRFADLEDGQRARLLSREVGPGFTPDASWQAAAGAQVHATGLMGAKRLGNRFGVSLLASIGVPSVFEVEIPGALQSRTRPPVGAQWFEIQLAR